MFSRCLLYRHNAAIGTDWNLFFWDNSLYLRYLLSNHPNIFGESSYDTYLEVLYIFLIQQPGEPREQHLGEIRLKKFKLQKMSWKTKWPEWSIYTQSHFEKNEKVQNEVGPVEHVVFGKFNLQLSKTVLFWVLGLQF